MSNTLLVLAIVGLIVIWACCGCYENFQEVYLPQTRRNMSHDLRGDIPIPYFQVSPWNNPEVGPIYNRQLYY
jgi:hypothetical protein